MDTNIQIPTMEDYKEYSKKQFLSFREEKCKNGYMLYQPKQNPNMLIYANRNGIVFLWEYDQEKKEVRVRMIFYPRPFQLPDQAFEFLYNAAKSRHWEHSWVKKIETYRNMSGAERDRDGIDQFLYAWMARMGYLIEDIKAEGDISDVTAGWNSLSFENFSKVCVASQTLDLDLDELIENFEENEDVFNFNEWYNNLLRNCEDGRVLGKVLEFVNAVLPSRVIDEGTRINAVNQINKIVTDALQTAE